MALKNTLDPTTVRSSLAAWLPSVLPEAHDVTVADVTVNQSSGMSSESVLFTARWIQDGAAQQRGMVVRVAPVGGGLFPSYDLAREAQVMRAVAASTSAPMPEVLAHESTGDVLGGPFLLVERVFGEVPGDDPPFTMAGWVADLDDEQRARLYDNAIAAIAEVHRTNLDGLEILAEPEHGEGPIAQGLGHWRAFYEWAAAGRRSSVVEAGLDWLEQHAPAEGGPTVLSWGDSRLGNMMFGVDQAVTGVFDWEMAALGRPEVDLAYFLFLNRVYTEGLGVPVPGGFPDRLATAARYEELTGHVVSDLDWFEIYAGVRGAILILRVGSLMIELGLLPPDNPMPLQNPAAGALAQLLGMDRATTSDAWITGKR